MTLVQKLVDVCCETVCLREELALITPQRDLGADLVGKCCRVDLPRQDAPRETELILRCLLCAKKLRRDIRWLLDILHSERRELRPGMVSLEYARQLLFIHTFISYLDQKNGQEAPRPATTIKLAVDVVPLSVMVTGQRGQAITGLKREDFRVYENGVEQAISFFGSEKAPVSWGLVLDRSGSMSYMIQAVYLARIKNV